MRAAPHLRRTLGHRYSEEPIALHPPGRDPSDNGEGSPVGPDAITAISRRRTTGRRGPATWIVAGRSTLTDELLVEALRGRGIRSELVPAARVTTVTQSGDVVLGRLDVRKTLDSVEDGIWELRRVERRGIRVLNPAPSLYACHDKLQTALRRGRAGVPHPATSHIDSVEAPLRVGFPIVLKPRFGSWGADVFRCDSRSELERLWRQLTRRAWFRRQGVLVQELIPPAGCDLRVVVSRGRIVGAIERVAADGEWRTNIALGGQRRRVEPSTGARALALEAAGAVGGDLVGVDLLPLPGEGFAVLEVNGAVEFTREYSLAGEDVFAATAAALATDERKRESVDARVG
jgi:RimK family alpha-L-glutamate ligase